MYLASLALTDFRTYPAVELDLDPGVVAFVGRNGQGKTNLVEAVSFLATLDSHRVTTIAPLVRAGCEHAVVRGTVVRPERTLLIEMELTPGRAVRVQVNRNPMRRVRDVVGALRTVTFAPEDLELAKGDPSTRRRFLDELAGLRIPRLRELRSEYDRILKQRNALLKTATPGRVPPTLEVWDQHLAEAGAALMESRLTLVGLLAPLIGESYRSVADDSDEIGVEYVCSVPLDGPQDSQTLTAAMLERISQRRREELARGISLVGPHRDDLLLSIGALPARGYASHGESWSLALALRLASFDLLRSDGLGPVLILDDVFAELDVGRRERLAELVGPADQVLITAAVAEDLPSQLSGSRFTVTKGSVARDR